MHLIDSDQPAADNAAFHQVRQLLGTVAALQNRQQEQETRRMRDLLQHPHVRHHLLMGKARAQLTSARHNIFEVLGVADKENHHSRFIAYLFNPRGVHDQGDLFLRPLLQWLESRSGVLPAARAGMAAHLGAAAGLGKAMVSTELYAEKHGRLDLVIELSGGTSIAIENKVYAVEQDKQLSRYWDWLRSRPGRSAEQAVLIFLSPDGRSGTTARPDDTIVLMSYADLALVLERGLAECPPTALSLIQSVRQYTQLCQNLAAGTTAMTQPNADIQNLLDDPLQLEAAFTLAAQLEEKKKAIRQSFSLNVIAALNKQLEAAGLQKHWMADKDPEHDGAYGIGVVGAFGANYRCVAEYYFTGWVEVGWLNAVRKQNCKNASLPSEMASRMNGDSDNDWWLCKSAPLKNQAWAQPLMTDTSDNTIEMHADNRSEKHPMAELLANEIWAWFEPFQQQMQELSN